MTKKRNSKGATIYNPAFNTSKSGPRSTLSFTETIYEARICLILFLISVSFYSYFFIPRDKQTIFGMILKCLPIVSLQASVLLRPQQLGPEATFQRTILTGLILSSIGNAFLDFPGFFVIGTIPLSFAQICYIWAFGISPLKPKLGLIVFILMSLPIIFISGNVQKQEFTLLVAVFSYALLLKVMVWRALSRMGSCCSSDNKEPRDWPKIFGGIGAISFGISDAVLGVNRYYTPVPYAQAIIMGAYYLAQLGITLTTFTGTSESIVNPSILGTKKSK